MTLIARDSSKKVGRYFPLVAVVLFALTPLTVPVVGAGVDGGAQLLRIDLCPQKPSPDGEGGCDLPAADAPLPRGSWSIKPGIPLRGERYGCTLGFLLENHTDGGTRYGAVSAGHCFTRVGEGAWARVEHQDPQLGLPQKTWIFIGTVTVLEHPRGDTRNVLAGRDYAVIDLREEVRHRLNPRIIGIGGACGVWDTDTRHFGSGSMRTGGMITPVTWVGGHFVSFQGDGSATAPHAVSTERNATHAIGAAAPGQSGSPVKIPRTDANAWTSDGEQELAIGILTFIRPTKGTVVATSLHAIIEALNARSDGSHWGLWEVC